MQQVADGGMPAVPAGVPEELGKVLQGLVEAGLVLPVSSGRGRHYILRD